VGNATNDSILEMINAKNVIAIITKKFATHTTRIGKSMNSSHKTMAQLNV